MSNFNNNFDPNSKKELKEKIMYPKKVLSDSEVVEFTRILKQDSIKRKHYDAGRHSELSPTEAQYVFDYLKKNRKIVIQSLNFSLEEMSALEVLCDDFQNQYMTKVYFHFAFLTIDHNRFIKENISLDDAIEGKLNFVLGLLSLKQIDEDSRKTVLFQLIQLLREYCNYAYKGNSFQRLSDSNNLLADFGSILSISLSPRDAMYSASSLFLNCLFELNIKNKRFAYYVSEKDAESSEFKRVYDFYFKHKGKEEFETAVLKAMNKSKEVPIFNDDTLVTGKVDLNVKRMMAKYSSSLDLKLSNLRKKGDVF